MNDQELNQTRGKQVYQRIDFIQKLLKNSSLKPLINLNLIEQDIQRIANNNLNILETLDKEKFPFNEIIKQIGGKLKYIKSGTTGHIFRAIMKDENNEIHNYAVKIVAYPKKSGYGNIHDKKRPENVELLMLKALGYFIVKNQTPHIILPIGTFNTSINWFMNLSSGENKLINNKKYDEFVQKCKNGDFYDQVSVLLSEWATDGDLLDYLKNNYTNMSITTWRVILFQLISVLAVIQTKYPAFRHNDLKANNILINKNEAQFDRYRYIINDRLYIIPNIDFQIKIWDYDFACIPNFIDNTKVSAKWTSKINITPEANRYYDLHYFLNTLTKRGFFPQFFTSNEIPTPVKEFVKRIVPTIYTSGEYIHERGRLLADVEPTTPDEILKYDPFFNKYRHPDNKIVPKLVLDSNPTKIYKREGIDDICHTIRNMIPEFEIADFEQTVKWIDDELKTLKTNISQINKQLINIRDVLNKLEISSSKKQLIEVNDLIINTNQLVDEMDKNITNVLTKIEIKYDEKYKLLLQNNLILENYVNKYNSIRSQTNLPECITSILEEKIKNFELLKNILIELPQNIENSKKQIKEIFNYKFVAKEQINKFMIQCSELQKKNNENINTEIIVIDKLQTGGKRKSKSRKTHNRKKKNVLNDTSDSNKSLRKSRSNSRNK